MKSERPRTPATVGLWKAAIALAVALLGVVFFLPNGDRQGHLDEGGKDAESTNNLSVEAGGERSPGGEPGSDTASTVEGEQEPAPNPFATQTNSGKLVRGKFPLRTQSQIVEGSALGVSGAETAAKRVGELNSGPEYLSAAAKGDPLDIALEHLLQNAEASGYTTEDFADPAVTSRHTSKHNGLTHLYLRQRFGGIEVYNADLNTHITADGRVVSINNAFIPGLADEINRDTPVLDARQAVLKAAESVSVEPTAPLTVVSESEAADRSVVFDAGDMVLDPVPAKLMYLPNQKGETRLVWNTVLRLRDGQHWLDMNVDAETGEVLSQANWIAKASYRVFAAPLENPGSGARTLEVDPHDVSASPYGWHDTNGASGAEFTDTRGNNVYAQEDANADNSGGMRPNGGPGLTFDFPLDVNATPSASLSASITNLFYWNNLLHDIHYQYGFDEAAGNFQKNNYGNSGAGNDQVFADAMDGSDTNNANFGTPPDGASPRMQMFAWSGLGSVLSVTFPSSVAGDYVMLPATFGSVLTGELTAELVLAQDPSPMPTRACLELINYEDIEGNIALIDSGSCNYVDKAIRAQDAGAVGVVIANHVPGGGPLIPSGIDYSIQIPVFSISYADGQALRGFPRIDVTLSPGVDRDSSLDNGIIIHEYGHGVSNRLTGGAANSSALQARQSNGMGEGWSDLWALALTAVASDTAVTTRGLGNYVLGEDASGPGIRPYRYTTNLSINPQTYGDLAEGHLSVPHGIGSVWCSILWEVYWALVATHGFDADFHAGSGGNNIALQLIMDGLKLQPANPSFVDARDAILLADQINNGGANQTLLWTAFAKRGLGFSAFDGGSPGSLDVVEAFDLPDALTITPGARSPFHPAGPFGGPFVPAARVYTLENTGAVPLNWSAADNVPWLDLVPASGALASGATVDVMASLNASSNSRPTGAHSGTITFSNITGGTSQLRGVELSVNDLADALDLTGPGAVIHTSSPAWFSQAGVTHDGIDAAQSGPTDHDQASVMKMTAEGPDTLVFWWKVSSEPNWDFLHLVVDGTIVKSISGIVDWTQVSHEIPAGSHTIAWEYRKDGSVDGGADTAWVDEVVFASNQPPLITSSLAAAGLVGRPFSYQIEATENPTSYGSGSLPAGLALNPATGEISGTPSVVGDTTVEITATNALGSSSRDLVISVRSVSSLPFTDNFESGALGPEWLASGTGGARTEVTQLHGPFEGSHHLVMDNVGSEASRNELTLALNLSGQSNVLLTFWAREYSDESHGPPPLPFVDGADFDGVAISEDGETWFEVRGLRGEMRGEYGIFAVDLDDAISRHGLSYGPDFRIRFNHFDEGAIPTDGFGIDDVRVQSLVPQTTLELTSGGDTTMPVFSGVANPNAYVFLRSHRDGIIGTVTADGSGNWSITSIDLRPGFHRITASVYGLPVTELTLTIEGDSPGGKITEELVPFESQWKYLDDGSDQYSPGTPFYAPAFDDSGWAENVARFGYGGDGEQTVVSYGGNASNRHIATYFRKTFDYQPSDTVFERGVLSVYADDGAMVYLNGVLLQSRNMPGGAVGSSTLASSNVNGTDERVLWYYEFDPTLVQTGENHIAVAVHQRAANSDDLGFDLRLALTRDWYFPGAPLESTFREVGQFVTTDLDLDGDQDILYTHGEGQQDQYRYMLNLGDNLFDDPVIISTAGIATENKPVVADLNNDGLPDFVTYSVAGAGIQTWTNDGIANGFTREVSHTNFSARGVCLGDLDGDGFLDLIYQRYPGGNTLIPHPVYWRKNDQTGDFGNEQHIADLNLLNSGSSAMHAVDLDGDGDLDLVASIIEFDKVVWLENDGSGNFSAEQTAVAIVEPYGIHPGDLDGDGDMDLIVDRHTTTFWYENDGTGSFGRAWTIQRDRFLETINLVDIDDDGDLDIFCEFNPFNQHIEWRENDGNGNFTQAQRFVDDDSNVVFIDDVEIVDWTGNGANDIIILTGGRLRILESKSGAGPRITTFDVDDNTVSPGATVTLSWDTDGATEVKLDGEIVGPSGSVQRVIGDEERLFSLTARNADGITEELRTVFVPAPSFVADNIVTEGFYDRVRGAAVGDFDGNGTADVVVAAERTHQITWLSNDGTGQFSNPIPVEAGNYFYPYRVAAGDFDNDGDDDIVAVSFNDSSGDPMVIYLNNGDGTFAPRQVIDSVFRGFRLRSEDVNDDGNLDLVYGDSGFEIRLGLGNGSFLPAIDIRGGAEDLKFADLNGDGLKEVLKLGGSNMRIGVARSVLDYPDEDEVLLPFLIRNSSMMEIDDYDSDGLTDIFVQQSNGTTLLMNRGLIQFNALGNEVPHLLLNDVEVTASVDWDLDGDRDIIALSHDSPNSQAGTIYWVATDGHGGFSEVQIISDTVPTCYYSLPIADFDGDGAPDVLVHGLQDKIVWVRNTQNRPPAPTLSSESNSGVTTDNLTSESNPDFVGTVDPGETISLYSSLDGFVGTTVADGTGAWAITTGKLSDGEHLITISTDGGNFSSSLVVVIDTVAEVPLVLDLDPATDTGVSDSDGVTNNATPKVHGSAETGSSVVLTSSIDGVIGSGTANAEFWIQTSALSDGIHQITAVATDLAGNVSEPSAPLSITIDNTPPAAIAAPDLTDNSDTGASANDDLTSLAAPVFEGSSDVGSTVKIFAGGSEVGSGPGGANWSIAASGLTDGVHSVTVSQTDSAGNLSPPSPALLVTVDLTVPSTSITGPTANATFDVESYTIDLAGSASDSSGIEKVEWQDDHGGSGTAAGTTSWSVGGLIPPAGSTVYTVTATDQAGNTGTDVLTVENDRQPEQEVTWKIGDMLANPALDLVYVINETGSDVVAINTLTGAVDAAKRCDYDLQGGQLFVSSDGATLYVSVPKIRKFYSLNGSTLAENSVADLDRTIGSFVVAADGFLYAVDTAAGEMVKVNLGTGQTVANGHSTAADSLFRLSSTGVTVFVLERSTVGAAGTVSEYATGSGLPSPTGSQFLDGSSDRDLSVDDANDRLYRASNTVNGVGVWNITAGTQASWAFTGSVGAAAVTQVPVSDSLWGASADPLNGVIAEFSKSTGAQVRQVAVGSGNSALQQGVLLDGALEVTPNGKLLYGKALWSGDVQQGIDGYFYYLGLIDSSSNSFSYTTPSERPYAPSDLTATDGSNDAGVVLTWNSSHRADEYHVYRSLSDDSGTASQIAAGLTATTFSDTGALPDTTYYYWVSAANSAGESGFGFGDAGERPLGPPAGLTASDASDETAVVLNWSAAAGATSYTIYRNGTDNSATATELVSGIAATTYSDTTAAMGVTYFYWLQSVDGGGPSAWSPSDAGTRKIGVPVDLALDVSDPDHVTLSWSPITGIGLFKIYRGSVDDPTQAVEIAEVNETSYADAGTLPASVHFWYVRSVVGTDAGDFSAGVSGSRIFPAPLNVTATQDNPTMVFISWDRLATALDGYEVFRSATTDFADAVLLAVKPSALSSHFDVTPPRGVPFYYWVRAVRGATAGAPGGPQLGFRLGETFDEYATRYGLEGDDALPTADVDDDGSDNFSEWAQGLTDPTDSGSSPPRIVRFQTVGGSDYFTLWYLRLLGGTENGDSYEHRDATYSTAGGLRPGVWDQIPLSAPAPVDLPAAPDGYEWGGVRLPQSTDSAAEGFLKLDVSAP